MPTAQLDPVVRRLRSAALGGIASLSDRNLLERFAASRDEAAFAALVRRHGTMVLAVCRRRLRDWHAAQDAFQATFLVLARKAGTLAEPDLVARWLHGVACRTAVRARADAARRRARENRVEAPPPAGPDDGLLWRDLRPVLDEEIARLPRRQGAAVVLCYLEGRTNAEAAHRLGCSRGTVATLLARARERLRRRLTGRGVALPAGLAAALAGAAQAAGVPGVLESSTVRAACAFAARSTGAAGPASARAVSLAEGVTRTMTVKKLKVIAVALLVVGLAGAGAGLTNYRATGEEPIAAPAASPPRAAQPAASPAAAPRASFTAAAGAYRTTNFVVTAPTWELAERIAQHAERRRKVLAQLWLGRDLPDWAEPCPVQVKFTAHGPGGATSFQFDAGKLVRMNMSLEGPLDRIVTDFLPHEVTHAILADWFGRPLPRWADEGAATLAESAASRLRQERAMWEVLDQGRMIPLRRLLALHDFPQDAAVLYAQGHSLAEFLVNARGRGTFLSFVREGDRSGWNKAVRDYYKYPTVDDLQAAWLADVRKARRAVHPVAARPQTALPTQKPPTPAAPPARPTPAWPSIQLPLGPAPVQALVTFTDDGCLGVWNQRVVYQGRTTYTEQGHPVTSYRAVAAWDVERYDRREVRVFDARGKEIEAKDWPRLVKGEMMPALVAVDGRPVDPLHLRLIKEGTLVFVLPGPRPPVTPPVAPAVAVPAPVAAPPAVVPQHVPPAVIPPAEAAPFVPPAVVPPTSAPPPVDSVSPFRAR
jgi:RNA polymerase sigma factor (sigma-70 family)